MKPIVLVHGAWHGPWCWENVSRQLGNAGHQVVEVTLPGHDRPGDMQRIWPRMSQYIATVTATLDELAEPAVVVGHSMGGYTVQRCLERRRAAAGVLVASVPWRGTLRPNIRAIRSDPAAVLGAMLTADYGRLVRTTEQVRRLFFTADTPDQIVEETMRRLQNESALALTAMAVRRIHTGRISTPMVVIGAAGDDLFTVAEQRELANAYGVEARIFAGGHDLMLDTTWPTLAECLGDIATAA